MGFLNDANYIVGGLGIALLLAGCIGFIGLVKSTTLSEENKKIIIRKYVLIGLGIFIFCLPMFKPYVSSYSRSEGIRETASEELKTIEEISKTQLIQAENIESLKKDVVELKRQLKNTHLYYSFIIQMFSIFGGMLCFNFAFQSKINSEKKITTEILYKKIK